MVPTHPATGAPGPTGCSWSPSSGCSIWDGNSGHGFLEVPLLSWCLSIDTALQEAASCEALGHLLEHIIIIFRLTYPEGISWVISVDAQAGVGHEPFLAVIAPG